MSPSFLALKCTVYLVRCTRYYESCKLCGVVDLRVLRRVLQKAQLRFQQMQFASLHWSCSFLQVQDCVPAPQLQLQCLEHKECRWQGQGKMDITLVLKIDIFSMPRFHRQRGNSSLVGKRMLLEV